MISRFERGAGFTLVELLIVLGIMAAASVWFMTYLRTGNTGTELRAATRELSAALAETRSLAVASDRVTALVVDGAQRLYRDPLGIHRVPPNLTLSVSGGGGDGNAIYFFPDGSSSGGTITVAVSRASAAVRVDWFTGQAGATPIEATTR